MSLLANGEQSTIQVQSVLYNTSADCIERALSYIDNAARIATQAGLLKGVSIAYGDCSPHLTMDDEMLDGLRARYSHLQAIEYTSFGANLGSAAGHNRLLEAAAADFVMIVNPDVLAAPNLFGELLSALRRPGVGFVEARQLPVEHPKYYDAATGETGWASTACAMARLSLFRQLDGFDAETFFLYSDDVDFSWRVRLTGLKVVHQPSAAVFHDKRVSGDGGWIASPAERYYSAEAGLLLPYKYSRSDLTESYLESFIRSGDPDLEKAAEAFEDRRRSGRLPTQIDPDHTVAEFVAMNYAPHRFQAH